MKRRRFLSLMGTAALASGLLLTGCGGGEAADDRRIIRIGHVQSANHPDHLGLTAFADFINEKLGTSTAWRFTPASCWAARPRWCS